MVKALGDFDTVWDVLTIDNRGRLVRALVRRVEVDEANGCVTAVLVNLGGEVEPTATTSPSLKGCCAASCGARAGPSRGRPGRSSQSGHRRPVLRPLT